MSKVLRDIVVIDEDKCDGCGACVPACAEGALQIVDGKARLVSEVYCDGLGACLGECPRGAIRVQQREVRGFDEAAARRHVETVRNRSEEASMARSSCPSMGVTLSSFAEADMGGGRAGLQNWPIQLGLVSPKAAFLNDAHVVLAADCTGYSCAAFRDFVAYRPVLVACPKLDNAEAHLAKLTAILSQSAVRCITVLRMEVPCCSGLVRLVSEAIRKSGREVPLEVAIVGMDGQVREP